MARVIHLAYEAADIRRRYAAIHDEILGASLGRWASLVRLREPVDHGALDVRLAALESRLGEIAEELAGLPDEELTRRSKVEIPDALDRYVRALARAIGLLRVICSRTGAAEATGASQDAYGTGKLNEDKARYDSAVQEYRRWGSRLHRLLSTF